MHNIIKTEVSGNSIIAYLANGVVIYLNSNEGYINVHLSGIEGNIVATGFAYYDAPKLTLSNDVDIEYKPRKS